jgi:hypothetical protein
MGASFEASISWVFRTFDRLPGVGFRDNPRVSEVHATGGFSLEIRLEGNPPGFQGDPFSCGKNLNS